ncbi:MAG: DUF427 domain-containing protein [Xanthomonadales bacterium]|nr:DUF427 domain-containing protein [Xanthomonadales bacterium]
MKAIWNGRVIAQSDATIVVEGNHYFPPDSVDSSLLKRSDTTTVCSWKGTANYYTLVVDGAENTDAAWYYETPKDAAKQIAGRVAFWKGVEVS